MNHLQMKNPGTARWAMMCMAVLPGCCLDQITLKPELSTIDLRRAQSGGATLDVAISLEPCCPSGEQETIALRLQDRVTSLFGQVIDGRIDLDQYNELVRAAQAAVMEVVLLCSAREGRDPGLARADDLDRAWDQCSVLAGRISAALKR